MLWTRSWTWIQFHLQHLQQGFPPQVLPNQTLDMFSVDYSGDGFFGEFLTICLAKISTIFISGGSRHGVSEPF